MTKRKRALGILLTIALVLVVFTTGYTFAKYYTEIKGGGIGSIAKWSFIANNSEDTMQKISLVDTANQVSLVEGKIAPGTSGDFDIVIDATGSEVGVDYEVRVAEEKNMPTNLIYKVVVDGKTSENYTSLKELAEKELNGNIDTVNGESTKTIKVIWEWPYETKDISGNIIGDEEDLANGTSLNLNYEFVLQIIGTQSQNK